MIEVKFIAKTHEELVQNISAFLGAGAPVFRPVNEPADECVPESSDKVVELRGPDVEQAEEKIDRAAIKFRFAELVNSNYEKAEKLLDDLNADKFDDVSDDLLPKLAKALG